VHDLGTNMPISIIDNQRGWNIWQANWSHDSKNKKLI